MTDSVVVLGQGGGGLAEALAARGAAVDACYQCLRCSAGCPVLPFMDVAPNRVVRLVQMGLDERVLSSRTIWLCVSCQTCTTRCPNEVDIAHMMDVLRQESMRRKVPCPEPAIEKFHRAFLRVLRRGRVHELSLIGRYKLATGRFADDVKLGIEMFRRGRIKLLPPRARGGAAVRALFRKAGKGGGRWS